MNSLPMVENGSPVEIAGTFAVVVREFGNELGAAVDARFSAVGVPDWFVKIRDARRNAGMPLYDDKFDPRFLLKETTLEDSPIRDAISGFDEHWRREGYVLLRKINSWQHFSVEPNVQNLETVIAQIWDLALKSSLPMAQGLAALVTRLRNIRDGVYVSSQPMNAPKIENFGDVVFSNKLLEKVDEQIKRPPIGAPWNGPLGDRRIVISKALRDVTEKGISIRSQLPGGEDQVKEWLRYYPRGGDARVSLDGAVTGFIKGQPTLIGWIDVSEYENSSEIRGFISTNEFNFTGDDIEDMSTGELLSKLSQEPILPLIATLRDAIPAGAKINKTSFNELVIQNDDGTMRKVAHVHPGIWF
mgnify:CR=1 FL=1